MICVLEAVLEHKLGSANLEQLARLQTLRHVCDACIVASGGNVDALAQT